LTEGVEERPEVTDEHFRVYLTILATWYQYMIEAKELFEKVEHQNARIFTCQRDNGEVHVTMDVGWICEPHGSEERQRIPLLWAQTAPPCFKRFKWDQNATSVTCVSGYENLFSIPPRGVNA
jgi:hypothetical protein